MLLKSEFLSNFKVCCQIKKVTSALKNNQDNIDDYISMFTFATRVCRYLVHAELPNHIDNQILLSDYELFNNFFSGLILAY